MFTVQNTPLIWFLLVGGVFLGTLGLTVAVIGLGNDRWLLIFQGLFIGAIGANGIVAGVRSRRLMRQKKSLYRSEN